MSKKRITIIGAGPGGYVAGIKAAKLGADVTVIEKDKLGGTCLNKGCIPTKALLSSSEVLEIIKKAKSYGIILEGEIKADIDAIIERKNKIIERLNKGIDLLFNKNGVKIIKGKGEILNNREVKVIKENGAEERIKSDAIIIATGSSPRRIPLFPFDEKRVLTSDEILDLRYIPKSILIVGAGVIGCEFAMFYKGLGTDVTLVEMLDRALSTEDFEISKEIEKIFKKKKIKLYTKSKITEVKINENEVEVSLEDGKIIKAEVMLVAVGRKANIEEIGLERVGVNTEKGRIVVNEKMQTNVDGIYAIGDVIPSIQLAHVASFEGICAVENIMGKESIMDYTAVPHTIFTEPEIGAVGLTEEQALQKGYNISIGRFYFRGLGKGQASGKLDGFVKIVADQDNDKILGAHIIGPNATDLVHEIAVAITCGLKVSEVAEVVHSHPTFSEAVMEAIHDIHGQSIHNV